MTSIPVPLKVNKRPEPPDTMISTREEFVAAELERISAEEATNGDRA